MKTGRELLETHQNSRKADDWSSGASVDDYAEFPDSTGVGCIGFRGTAESEVVRYVLRFGCNKFAFSAKAAKNDTELAELLEAAAKMLRAPKTEIPPLPRAESVLSAESKALIESVRLEPTIASDNELEAFNRSVEQNVLPNLPDVTGGDMLLDSIAKAQPVRNAAAFSTILDKDLSELGRNAS